MKYLICMFLALTLWDGYATPLVIDKGYPELNPLMEWLLGMSKTHFLVGKFCLSGVASAGLYYFSPYSKHHELITYCMGAIVLLYALVGMGHALVLLGG